MSDQLSIHDFPWLADEGIIPDPNKLGAVMLPVRFRPDFLDRGYRDGIISESDLYTSKDPARFWISGDGTEGAHVTLLYGLLTPAYEQAEVIHQLLGGWRRPAWLPIVGFEVFPSPYDDENYACIVARVGDRDGALKRAMGLLEFLPHVNTFTEVKLHATIAYVQLEAVDRWLEYLEVAPRTLEVPATNGLRPSLDLGSPK